jgi:hypothetical protein
MRDALAGSRVTTLTGGFGELLSFAKSRSDDKVAPIPAADAQAGDGARCNVRAADIISSSGIVQERLKICSPKR